LAIIPVRHLCFLECFLEHLAVFAATSWECRAIVRALPTRRVERVGGVTWYGWEHPSCFVAVIQTGIGPANARAACQAVVAQRPWTVCIASGYAGALVPAHIGDLVIPEQVLGCALDHSTESVFPETLLACNAFYRQKAQDVAQSLDCAVIPGRMVTVRTMVCLAREKQSIGRACESSGLDMESAAIGSVAAQHGIPFVVVRSISDLVDEDVPRDVGLLCRTATFHRGVWAVVTAPRLWGALNRLRQQKNVASARLTRFFETFFLRLSDVRPTTRNLTT